MVNSFGKEIKVSMEMIDGRVFMGRCLMSTININQDRIDVTGYGDNSRYFIPGDLSWNLELKGIGSPEWRYGGDLAPGIASRILPQDWECEYCGRANSIKNYQCGSCGWYRGVIVDVVNELGVWRVKK